MSEWLNFFGCGMLSVGVPEVEDESPFVLEERRGTRLGPGDGKAGVASFAGLEGLLTTATSSAPFLAGPSATVPSWTSPTPASFEMFSDGSSVSILAIDASRDAACEGGRGGGCLPRGRSTHVWADSSIHTSKYVVNRRQSAATGCVGGAHLVDWPCGRLNLQL